MHCINIYRRQNVGLVGQWLTCHVHPKLFRDAEGGEEEDLVHHGYVVILEDDMQASPVFWKWLKAAWQQYRRRQDLIGMCICICVCVHVCVFVCVCV
jgi:hypothetical protein